MEQEEAQALEAPARYLGRKAYVEEKTKGLYAALRAHAAELKKKRLAQDKQMQTTAGSGREKI